MGYSTKVHDIPRDVSPPVILAMLFGGTVQQIGWFFFSFGMCFVWVFGGAADVGSLFEGDELRQGRGIVLERLRTSSSVNHRRIWELRFAFDVDGGERTDVCYGTGPMPDVDDEVDVEWPKDDPTRARIVGMRPARFPVAGFFMPLMFPLIGVIMAAFGLRRGFLRLHLARMGLPAEGVFVEKRPTNVRINRRMVYEMIFRFTDDSGVPRQISTRTHRPEDLQDESREQLLYDPDDPERAELVDAMPGAPEWTEAGLRLPSPLVGYKLALIPMTGLIGHGLFAALRFLAPN